MLRYHAPMPRRRLRTFTLWTGSLLCVLIAAAFVVSAWWDVAMSSSGPGLMVVAGSVTFVNYEWMIVTASVDRHSLRLSRWHLWGVGPRCVQFPLYAVLLAVAVPTLLAWRFWPKPIKPGHCRCGYNLTGNQSGKCPECGVEVQP